MIDAAFALQHYNGCRSIENVAEDFARLKYIKRLINNYKRKGELCERLLLNHVIVWFNVFEHKAALEMLFSSIEDWNILIPFVEYIDMMPLTIPTTQFPSFDWDKDEIVVDRLNKL